MAAIIAAAVVTVLAGTARAWGPTGHRVVAQVAENHLSEEAAAAVEDLLAPETLIEAANWPDEIRSDPAWSHAGPFHYVSIPDGQIYERPSGESPHPRDIVEAIEHYTDVLKDRRAGTDTRAIALRWIVHLIGDIHQPLHVGRAEDKGGNDIAAKWHGEDTNLHVIWDERLIDTTRLSYSEFAKSIDIASEEEMSEWRSTHLMTWLTESYRLRDQAYRPPGPEKTDSYRYSYVNMPLVRQRLLQAGVRLAAMLNDIFGACEPSSLAQRRDVRWLRRSAEYAVITRRLYAQAAADLRALVAARRARVPWVVAIDADETILDNSQFEIDSIRAGRCEFDLGEWRKWVEQERATIVPGAVDFLRVALELGGRVAVITNRDRDQNGHTRANLEKLDLPLGSDRLCVLGRSDADRKKHNKAEWELLGYRNDKDRRRRLVRNGLARDCWTHIEAGSERTRTEAAWSQQHEIVMSVGDNIQDLPRVTADAAATPALLRELAKNREYLVLPNPSYGSWDKRPAPRAP